MTTDRDRLAADLHASLLCGDGTYGVMGVGSALLMADRLIALGWTRLDETTVAVLQKALLIGSISHDGDGWFARDAGYDYDDAEATLIAARRIVESLAKAYREDGDAHD